MIAIIYEKISFHCLRKFSFLRKEVFADQFAKLPEKWITLKKRITLFDLRTTLYFEKFVKLPVSLFKNFYKFFSLIFQSFLLVLQRSLYEKYL